jgi:hypothetical protein
LNNINDEKTVRKQYSSSEDKIIEILSSQMRDGVLCVPKEYGMFIAK